ncbi:MAG: hypothetical protein QNK36_10515 [Colwellia sp.]|nr:hypothetical protein [Colwellia sp.]
MAFNKDNWARQSDAMNTGGVTVDAVIYNAPAVFSYRSAGDNSATIQGADYFANAVYDLAVGDILDCQGSDTLQRLSIATIDRAAGTITTNVESVTTVANDSITSAKMDQLLLKYAAVAVSAAAFNGAYATPVQLVAAAGADTLLVLDRVQLLMTYNSAAYAAGGVLAVQYDSTANGAGIIASTTLAAATFQGTVSEAFAMNAGVVDQPFSTAVNKGLYLSNVTQAFTTGDSAMVAHVWYKEIPSV